MVSQKIMKQIYLILFSPFSNFQRINSDDTSSPHTDLTNQTDELITFNRIKPASNRFPPESNKLATDYPEPFAGDPRSSPATEIMQLSTRQINPNNAQGGIQPQPGTQAGVPTIGGVQQPVNGNPQVPQNQIPQTGAGTIPQQTPTAQFPQTPNAMVPQAAQQPFLPNQNGAATFPQTNVQPQFNQQFPQTGGQFPGGNVPPTLNTPQAQAAYNYMVGEFYNILNDPVAREGLPHLARFFRRLLSSPNALRVLNELDKLMDSNVFGQPGFLNYLQNTLSTPIQSLPYQMQSGSIFDLLKQKLFAILNYGKDVANAKVKMVNGFFDGGVFAPMARVGTNLVNSGIQAVDGTVTPLFNGVGSGGGGFGTSGFGSSFPTQFGSPTQFGTQPQCK